MKYSMPATATFHSTFDPLGLSRISSPANRSIVERVCAKKAYATSRREGRSPARAPRQGGSAPLLNDEPESEHESVSVHDSLQLVLDQNLFV